MYTHGRQLDIIPTHGGTTCAPDGAFKSPRLRGGPRESPRIAMSFVSSPFAEFLEFLNCSEFKFAIGGV